MNIQSLFSSTFNFKEIMKKNKLPKLRKGFYGGVGLGYAYLNTDNDSESHNNTDIESGGDGGGSE